MIDGSSKSIKARTRVAFNDAIYVDSIKVSDKGELLLDLNPDEDSQFYYKDIEKNKHPVFIGVDILNVN